MAARSQVEAVATRSAADVLLLQGLRAEVARLREDNEDLRASLVVWVRLYEAAVARASELDARLSGNSS
jgi:hypothetical protein